jgi:hypothetical protein
MGSDRVSGTTGAGGALTSTNASSESAQPVKPSAATLSKVVNKYPNRFIWISFKRLSRPLVAEILILD